MKPMDLLNKYLKAYEENNQIKINAYLHPKYKYLAPGGKLSINLKNRIVDESFFFKAFKVIRAKIENYIEKDDQIACHIVMKCRHIGRYFDIEKTNRIITISYIEIITIRDGKIYKERAEFDMNSILEQIR
jgi:predicted ester cyclase